MRIKDKVFEMLGALTMAFGIVVGSSEHADASDFYYGDHHGGDINHPPDGSVISVELTEKTGYLTSVDSINNTYYQYIISHWFDPQQMVQFPAEVWMYGIAPYDHSSGE